VARLTGRRAVTLSWTFFGVPGMPESPPHSDEVARRQNIAKEVATRTRRRSGVRLFAKQAAEGGKSKEFNKNGTNVVC